MVPNKLRVSRKSKPVKNPLRSRCIWGLLLAVGSFSPCIRSAPQAKYPMEPVFVEAGLRELASSRQSMVSSAHPFATNAGVEMLRRGGNAIDAAIAAVLVTAVVDTGMTSLAGGGVLTFYDAKSKRATAVNFEAQGVRDDVRPYNRRTDTTTGRSIRVPGTFAGLHFVLRKYGSLPWKDVLEPAIFYAENGFPIHGRAYMSMRTNARTLSLRPSGRRIFAPDGFLPPIGAIFKQPELAETLKKIAEQGPDYFYKGSFAEEMVKAIRDIGGEMTLEDLASYRAIELEPVRTTYKNYEIIGAPPPNIGAVGVIEGMNILENVDLEGMGHYSKSADALQWFIETMRVVDAHKFSGVPELDRALTQALISKEYARSEYEIIRQKIERSKRETSNRAQLDPPEAAWDEYEKHNNTNNVSVIDKDGNICSVTNTIYGSVYATSGLFVGGLVLNSGRGHPGLPGRRMLNPKAPMIVLKDGKPYFAAGSSGGITNPFFLIANALVWGKGKTFKEIQEAPRFRIATSFYTGAGMEVAGNENEVSVEDRIDESVIKELSRRGYRVDLGPAYSGGGAQMVGMDPDSGIRYGASDPRSVGQAAGQ